MTTPAYKRRRFLIDRLQVRLLAIALAYLLVTAAVLSLAVFGPLMWELRAGNSGLDQAAAAAQFLSLHARFWPAMLVTAVAMSLHSILTTHRIAGPLYRFRVVFGQVKEGNLVPWVGLRRRDYLWNEASALEEMIASLRERVGALSDAHGDAARQTADLAHALADGSAAEARGRLAALEQALSRQRQQLDAFRLERD